MFALLARFVLWLLGWKVYGKKPEDPKYLYLAFPHSSNWDGLYLLLFSASLGLNLKWLGKKSLMKPPLGWLLKWLGGIGIDRSKSSNVVDQMVKVYSEQEKFVLAVPPEGSRGHRECWKSGFYHIALAADVPVCCGILDYKRKLGGFGPTVKLTGDMGADMDRIRQIYQELAPVGQAPDKIGPIRFKDESQKLK